MLSKHQNQDLQSIIILFRRDLGKNEFANVKQLCRERGAELNKQQEFKDSVQQAIDQGCGHLANILIEYDFPISTECKPSLVTTTLGQQFADDKNDEEKIKILKELVKKIPPTFEDFKLAKILGEKFLNILILHSHYNMALHRNLLKLFDNNLIPLIEYYIKNNLLEHIIKNINGNSIYNLIFLMAKAFAEGKDVDIMLAYSKKLLQDGMELSARTLTVALECKDTSFAETLVNNFQEINMTSFNDGSEALSESAAKMLWKYPKLILYFIDRKIPMDIWQIQVGASSINATRKNIYPIKSIFDCYQKKLISQGDMISILEAIKKTQPELFKKDEIFDLAIQLGDEKVVNYFINNGATILPFFKFGDNALDKAVKSGHTQIVKTMLAINTVDWDINKLNHALKLCTPEQVRLKYYLSFIISVVKTKLIDKKLLEKIHPDDLEELKQLLKNKYHFSEGDFTLKPMASIKQIHGQQELDMTQVVIPESKQNGSPSQLGLFKDQQPGRQFLDRDSWLKALKECLQAGQVFLKDQETLPSIVETILQEVNRKKL